MALNDNLLIDYPWLTKAYQQLTLPLTMGKNHHALLIKYILGCGEDELIYQLIMRLLCLSPHKNHPCKKCHSCQLFLADNHPDYHLIEPEKTKSTIGIDQIRKISTKIYEHSQQGGNKVIWVKTASLMTEAAANALLKTLEEPPENTYFILSDIENGQLLPTIRSRCRFYFLTPPENEISKDWLKSQTSQFDYNDNQLMTALLLNNSAPFAALSLLEQQQWQQRTEFCQALTAAYSEQNLWSLRDSFLQSDNLLGRLSWFCILLSDALKAKQKVGKFIVNRDQVPLIRIIANVDIEKIIHIHTLWNETRVQLITIIGLNHELIVSNLLAQSEIILNSSAN